MSVAVATATGAMAQQSEVHTFHCLNGCPVGAPATNDLVVREIYTLSSNDLTKLADWVAYRVTRESIGQSGDREWRADPWLSIDETLRPSDYDAASGTLHVDRGHQAPLASFSGTPSAGDTNLLSNITPQSSALNQGPWVRLEDQERALAQRLGVPVYVLTGPLFERMMRPLPGTAAVHRVPSGYWKVVALADGRATAFVFDQADARRRDHCSARVSLAYAQVRARLFLFPGATTPPTPLDAELGCQTAAPTDPIPSQVPVEPPTVGKRR